MATAIAPEIRIATGEDDDMDRFYALVDEVCAACSRVAGRVHGRDRAGLLMAAALLRLDLAELDRGKRTSRVNEV